MMKRKLIIRPLKIRETHRYAVFHFYRVVIFDPGCKILFK